MKGNLKKLDTKQIQSILVRENKFLSDLFSIIPVPTHEEEGEEEEEGTTHVSLQPNSLINQPFSLQGRLKMQK